MTEPRLTPESAKALVDKVIDENFVPKKVPHATDVDEQSLAVSGALASSLLTALDLPLTISPEEIGKIARQMVALGIRQTQHVDPHAVKAPAWITDGVRQKSLEVPPQPKPTEAEPFENRTAVAPTMPKRIPRGARAVKR